MQGYVARKGDRFYAVIYEGIDPNTGRERRRWHPAGTDRASAEQLATDLARRRQDDGYERCSLTVAVYLTQRWLPPRSSPCAPAPTTPTGATSTCTSPLRSDECRSVVSV